MRTVVNYARRPNFRLGLTPPAVSQYNTATQDVQDYLDAATSAEMISASDEIRARWMPRFDALQAELTTMTTAAITADNSTLPELLVAIENLKTRAVALFNGFARAVFVARTPTQTGFLYGAAAVGLGLALGFIALAFGKRS